MAESKDLEKDMLAIARLVYETSKKYGDIYICSACCKGSNSSWTTYGEDLEDVDYYSEV